MFNTRADFAPKVDVPLVFVGYGLRIPEKNYDDFSGLDLKGKVAVIITGSPSEMPSPLASHYQSMAERAKALRDAGAVGLISRFCQPRVHGYSLEPDDIGAGSSQHGASRSVSERLARDQAAGGLQPAGADKLFEGSSYKFQQLADLAKDRKPLPRFALASGIKARAKVIHKDVESENIVAKLSGTDPTLKKA